MGGKVSMFLVIGFSIIFMAVQFGFNKLASDTNDNFTKYYVQEKSHYIAVAGVNIVINKLFLDAAVADQTFNMNYDGGTISASLTTLDNIKNIKQLLSTGSFFGISSTAKIILKPSLFSKYAYFSNSENGNIWWIGSDTVWGPFHTNDDIRIANHPAFFGKASTGGGQILYDRSSSAKYLGGFQQGIQIGIPSNGVQTVVAQASGGARFTNKSLVYFEFRGDSIRYKYSNTGAYTYRLASAFAPNGVVSFVNAEVHLFGTVKGRYTVVVSGSSGKLGSFFIDDDIIYYNNPKSDPNSTDMLGIVAQRNVIITENTRNNSNIRIQAAIYCQEGSFTADNYDDRPVSGIIDLCGGITQNIRGAVGQFSGSRITSGFSKRYRYDERLLTTYPPYYPGCGSFEVVSWFE